MGTSFNIRSTEGQTQIVVESGLVQVSWQGKTVLIHADEGLTLKGDSLVTMGPIKGRLYDYYRTHEFKCDHTPLWQLALALDEAFDVHIVIEDPAIRDLPLTATFRDESLDEILSVITATFNIKPVRHGNIILLQ
jgi:ferric-dicitrate binding protein FerR (iron transport regulator)